MTCKFSVSIALKDYGHLTLYRKLVKCQAVPKAHLVHHLVKPLEPSIFVENLTLAKGILESFLGLGSVIPF